MKPRNFHQLAVIRRESTGRTQVVPMQKRYTRKRKHKKEPWE